jgi:hypothetical protein
MLELPVEEQEQMLLQLRAARDGVTGTLQSVISERKNRWLFIERWRVIEQACPDTQCVKSYVSRTTTGGTKAKAVALWLAQHPRFELVCVPGDCPRANPIERAFGDVPDKCTRNHNRR